MRAFAKILMSLVMAGVLLITVPAASAQKAKPTPPQPAPAPAPMAQQPGHQQVVVVEPVRVFDPFFTYPYPTRIRPITWRQTSDT